MNLRPAILAALMLALLATMQVADAADAVLSFGEYFIRQSWSQEQNFPRPYHAHVPTN